MKKAIRADVRAKRASEENKPINYKIIATKYARRYVDYERSGCRESGDVLTEEIIWWNIMYCM